MMELLQCNVPSPNSDSGQMCLFFCAARGNPQRFSAPPRPDGSCGGGRASAAHLYHVVYGTGYGENSMPASNETLMAAHTVSCGMYDRLSSSVTHGCRCPSRLFP